MVIRGTTPTFKYTFSQVDPAEIVVAYFTISQDGAAVLEKDISSASIGDNSISWTLTQAETLGIAKTAEAMLNYRLLDGTRGASLPSEIKFLKNQKEEVI